MEEEQWHVGVGLGGQVRHRACTGEARVHLAEVELVGVQVVQQVHLEVAAVALAAQDVAQLCHHLSRGAGLCGW
ncbi:Uncharacterised protein [Mycobacterium tuberculosis]|nr:Uncharacterised protein [Mycobacterium tuberculosis]COX80525.1 Uncharacterised protein [Mycobacterium tuberculosis]